MTNFLQSLSTKTVLWLVCIGLALDFGASMFFFVAPQPASFLFYLNVRYWSMSMFILLWLIAIWLISEVLDLVENYHQIARYLAGTAGMFLLIASFVSPHLSLTPLSSFLISVVALIFFGCAVRSIVLLTDYYRGQIDVADLEEPKWFWGMTCFMTVILLVVGMMQIITFRIEISSERVLYESMWTYFYEEFWQTVKNGDGAIIVRLCCFLAFLVSLAFAFTIYQWAVSFIAKIREE